jgi:hypothetical protein
VKAIDRRATPRFRLQFRTAFSGLRALEGTGTILDLSLGGCRVESQVTVQEGVSLELRVYAPDLEWPLMIDEARVQWISGQTFGLAFVRVRDVEQQRLHQVLVSVSEHEEEENG